MDNNTPEKHPTSKPIPISSPSPSTKQKQKLNGFTSIIANDEEYLFFKKQPLFQSFCGRFQSPEMRSQKPGNPVAPNVSALLQRYLVFYLKDWSTGPYMVAFHTVPTSVEMLNAETWKKIHPCLSEDEFAFYLNQVNKIVGLQVDSYPALSEFCRIVQKHQQNQVKPRQIVKSSSGLLAELMSSGTPPGRRSPILPSTCDLVAYYLCLYLEEWQQFWSLCSGGVVLTSQLDHDLVVYRDDNPVICPAVLHALLEVLRSSSYPLQQESPENT